MTIDFTTYDDDNIFAKILRGELPNTTVHEDDHVLAFKLSFLNKCEEDEHPIIAEYFQRCFDTELDDSYLHVIERD